MGTGRSLQRIELSNQMDCVPTSNSTRKRARRRRLEKKSDVLETPLDDSYQKQFVNAHRETEALGTCASDTTRRLVIAEPFLSFPGSRPRGLSESPSSHCSISDSDIRPPDGKCSFHKIGRRIYALRPRQEFGLHQSPSLSTPEREDILDESRPPSNHDQEAKSETVVNIQPLENLRDGCGENSENNSDSGRESPPYRRRDSGVFAGRLKANPLRHLAALLRSKLLFHGSSRNLLELANEIQLEAKEKHNTTLRRIYDVVNVTEAAGLLERAIVSRSGRRKAVKGSPLSGSLIRWCSPPTTDTRTVTTEIVTIIQSRLFQKQEEFKYLEEELELLENLMRHRTVRFESATSADSTSTQFYTSENAGKSISNQLLYPSASVGLTIPFCLLKTNRRSDDGNLEVSTYADETEFQVTISSDHEIQPYEWRWILREMLKVSKSSLSTCSEDVIEKFNDELLMPSYIT